MWSMFSEPETPFPVLPVPTTVGNEGSRHVKKTRQEMRLLSTVVACLQTLGLKTRALGASEAGVGLSFVWEATWLIYSLETSN